MDYLSIMTGQDVFDKVAKHFVTQVVQSELGDESDTCAYRSPEGLTCAAGCIIPDEHYREEFEGTTWMCLTEAGNVPKEHRDLIQCLQGIHDDNIRLNALKVKMALRECALEYDIDPSILDTLNFLK